jgi:transposase
MSTKLHLLTDGLGRPVRALLTAGQVHDRTPAEALLADLQPACLVADRGYDARAWRTHLAARGTLAVIPAQRKRGDTAYTPARHGPDRTRYRQRNAIERTFAHLKQLRRFATRYDKRADCFLAWFQRGATLIWLKTVHTP